MIADYFRQSIENHSNLTYIKRKVILKNNTEYFISKLLKNVFGLEWQSKHYSLCGVPSQNKYLTAESHPKDSKNC